MLGVYIISLVDIVDCIYYMHSIHMYICVYMYTVHAYVLIYIHMYVTFVFPFSFNITLHVGGVRVQPTALCMLGKSFVTELCPHRPVGTLCFEAGPFSLSLKPRQVLSLSLLLGFQIAVPPDSG